MSRNTHSDRALRSVALIVLVSVTFQEYHRIMVGTGRFELPIF